MLPSKTNIGSTEESRGCHSPLAGQCDPVDAMTSCDFRRFQLVWLIFFISGFLALLEQDLAVYGIDPITQWYAAQSRKNKIKLECLDKPMLWIDHSTQTASEP
jgi:hypothetical protein